MIVKLDGRQTVTTGKKLAINGGYYDALSAFARVEGYESVLNQIGCLTMTYDDTYALTMMGELISRYSCDYDVYGDLSRLGDSLGAILRYYADKPSFVGARGKKTADSSLITRYDQFEEYGDVMEIIEEELSRVDVSEDSRIYDLHSPEYFQYLRAGVQSALIRRQTAKVRELEQKIVEFSPDGAFTLETKVMVCLHCGDEARALDFACKLAEASDGAFSAMRRAIEAIKRFSNTDENNSVIRRLMLRALDLSDESSDYYLRYLTLFAISELNDDEIASRFADKLFARYKDAGCLSLKLCALAFYNAKRFDLCRQATLLFIRALPRNPFGHIMLEYLDSDSVYTRMSIKQNMGWYFAEPKQLIIYASNRLEEKFRSNGVLDERGCMYMDFLYEVARGAILTEDFDLLDAIADDLREFIRAINVTDSATYVRFAAKQLATPLQEFFVNAEILAKLIRTGYRSKAVITLENDAYFLDLSKFGTQDEIFIDAFALSACMRKVSLKRMLSAYGKLKSFTNLPMSYDEDLVLQVTYFLLAVSYKDYAAGKNSDIFTEEERRLYDDYLSVSN